MPIRKSWSGATLLLFTLVPSAAFAGLSAHAGDNSSVEASVRSYFADTPVMIAVASCESEFTQFNLDGSVLHGGYRHTMIGIFQISPLHLKEARALGFGINTISRNISYAKHLYQREGPAPWLDSAGSWEKKAEAASARLESTVASANSSDPITVLQQQIVQLRAVLFALIAAKTSST